MDKIDITVIGGGANGLATTLRLAQKYPDKSIVVLEKEKHMGEAQSGHNSGVRHSGIQYRHDSLKGKLCMVSYPLMEEFCRANEVPLKYVGKLTVAQSDADVEYLRTVMWPNGEKNNIPNMQWLGRDEIKKLEPNVEAIAAIYTPSTGIFDAANYVSKLEKLIADTPTIALKKAMVTDVKPLTEATDSGFHVKVDQDGEVYEYETDIVINAAGLYTDKIARLVNPDFKYTVKPLKGEYMQFNKKHRPELHMNGLNVYPVPQIIEGMLDQHGQPKRASGTHLTPTFDEDLSGNVDVGNIVWVGPLAHVVTDKKDYSPEITDPQRFLEDVRRFFPSLKAEDLSQGQVGIQAKIVGYDDWVLEADAKFKNFYTMICDSPGVSSSQAISQYMVEQVIKI